MPQVASTEARRAAPRPVVPCAPPLPSRTPSFPNMITRGFEGDVGLGAQWEPKWKSQKGGSSWGQAA